MTRGDDVIALDGLRPRARAVLRMLAVHLGAGVHRQTLCDELWPDDDETGASRKLQVAISSIRRMLETTGSGEVVGRRGDVYLLDADRGVGCDVHEFSTAVSDARSLVGRGATTDAEPILRRALELYAAICCRTMERPIGSWRSASSSKRRRPTSPIRSERCSSTGATGGGRRRVSVGSGHRPLQRSALAAPARLAASRWRPRWARPGDGPLRRVARRARRRRPDRRHAADRPVPSEVRRERVGVEHQLVTVDHTVVIAVGIIRISPRHLLTPIRDPIPIRINNKSSGATNGASTSGLSATVGSNPNDNSNPSEIPSKSLSARSGSVPNTINSYPSVIPSPSVSASFGSNPYLIS